MNYKKFGILFISLFVIVLTIIATFVIIVDPYFHYHKPITNYELEADKQRYLNYGIVKNFNYDALITGTSMTENFKPSELNKLFNVNSIKISSSGAYYKETSELIKYALKNNKNIKMVLMSLDYNGFFTYKDDYRYDKEKYPTYLYDNNLINDIKYIYNKEVFIRSLYNLRLKKSTTFDEYSNWNDKFSFGKKELNKIYNRSSKTPRKKEQGLNNELTEKFYGNINQNIINLVKENSNVEFYFFYPPYSIYTWDSHYQNGTINRYIKAEKIFTENLLEYNNVHIYSFLDDHETINNLDNYKDLIHYSEDINSKILVDMKNHNHELTKDNYKKYYEIITKYYNEYNYDSLFN